MLPSIPPKYFLPLVGLAVSAFVFNTSEFMPIALLTDISDSFGKTPAETGIMITAYAWVVVLMSLPLMLAACRMEPKRLLLAVLGAWPPAWPSPAPMRFSGPSRRRSRPGS